MEWTERGIILGTRRHGESSVIVEAFTRDRGRHLGLVRGGRGSRMRNVLQAGNSATFTWRARLSEHLGHFTVEPETQRAARLMDDRLALAALNTLNALARLLPERDPHPALFALYEAIVSALPDEPGWPGALARFELMLLQDLGFGLDLASCAATGAGEDLIYVSPKTGRAVSRAAGEPYKERLLVLPPFLERGDNGPQTREELLAAFRLTGFFLMRDVFTPRGIEPSESRERLIRLLGEG